MSRFDPYVGLPYAKDGRGPEEFDCLGLCQHIFCRELGIDLPEGLGTYQPRPERASDGTLIDSSSAAWPEITEGQHKAFDIVLVREAPWHVGLVTEPGWMLHMPLSGFAVVERYDTARYALRVEGVYRHPFMVA